LGDITSVAGFHRLPSATTDYHRTRSPTVFGTFQPDETGAGAGAIAKAKAKAKAVAQGEAILGFLSSTSASSSVPALPIHVSMGIGYNLVKDKTSLCLQNRT